MCFLCSMWVNGPGRSSQTGKCRCRCAARVWVKGRGCACVSCARCGLTDLGDAAQTARASVRMRVGLSMDGMEYGSRKESICLPWHGDGLVGADCAAVLYGNSDSLRPLPGTAGEYVYLPALAAVRLGEATHTVAYT